MTPSFECLPPPPPARSAADPLEPEINGGEPQNLPFKVTPTQVEDPPRKDGPYPVSRLMLKVQ